MQVETYEIEEIKSSEAATMAADSESLEIARNLGLKGQLKISNTTTDTRCPYARLTQRQELVFGALFPMHTSVESYESGPIPLRVLQVLAHCKELGMFKRFEVWHPTDAKEPDPVLIAHTKGQYDSDNQSFLLARWGDALQPFEKLVTKAKSAWVANRKREATKILRDVQHCIENADVEADAAFATGRVETHSFYL